MEKEEIDYFGHVYTPGQKVEIDGNAVLLISRFLTEVVEKETALFASFVYPKKVHETKDENGEVIKVNYEWEDHTSQSFMLTAVDDSGAQLGLTQIGVKASQILTALLTMHGKNIEAGIAKKYEEINEQQVFRA